MYIYIVDIFMFNYMHYNTCYPCINPHRAMHGLLFTGVSLQSWCSLIVSVHVRRLVLLAASEGSPACSKSPPIRAHLTKLTQPGTLNHSAITRVFIGHLHIAKLLLREANHETVLRECYSILKWHIVTHK